MGKVTSQVKSLVAKISEVKYRVINIEVSIK